ncbi:hypothetical protein PE074_01810 [Wohlfahrtiimonas chitiniclastica]|uniref:hypothetical protein n=1 Tax=Wohlfahrtiimonas chitiniclastica TaxID=400946 RepID=UPI0007B413FF|nr:hypothetical protein [Wohlfahrtiimonas chitiniclastica]WHR55719.1 hypothetical protein PE074_01810 [Wohlfahrtiimonas chitiniclastica]
MFTVELEEEQVSFILSICMYAQWPLVMESTLGVIDSREFDETQMEALFKDRVNAILSGQIELDVTPFDLDDDFDVSVKEYIKTQEGKKLVFEYAIDNDLDLALLDDELYVQAIFASPKAREEVWLSSIQKTIKRYVDQDTSDLKLRKAILFALLNLENLLEDNSMKHLIKYAVREYQRQVNIDEEYLEELSNLSKKYIKLRSEILEVITE